MLQRIGPWRLTGMATPLVLWALHFVAVYSMQGLACAEDWQRQRAAAAPVAAGVAAGGAFGFAGFRTMYRSATKQAATAIDMLLQAVAVEAGTTGH